MSRCDLKIVGASSIVFMTILSGSSSFAETLTFACQKNAKSTIAADGKRISVKAMPFTFSYEGNDTGTLSVKAPYGEIVLDAHKLPGAAPGEDAGTRAYRYASGPIKIRMPDKAVYDRCLAAKTSGRVLEDKLDKDIAMGAYEFECRLEAPETPQPVDAMIEVRVGQWDSDKSQFWITRRYKEKSEPLDEIVELDDAGDCTLQGASAH